MTPNVNNTDMLARLLAQAEGDGADLITLRAIVEEAADMGADRALTRLNLDDDAAQTDMAELRELVSAWREAKRGAWKAALGWLIKGALALLLTGMAVRLGLTEFLAKGPLA